MTREDLGKKLICGLAGVLLLASGCQTAPSIQSTGIDNPGFMSLWETYTDCKATSDLTLAREDMKKLAIATQLRDGTDGFILPLPTTLERLVTNPTSRFAVDVQAMAAACSIHAGQLALALGQIDFARDVFATVAAQHRGESSYYALQAKTFLTELERGIDISLRTP